MKWNWEHPGWPDFTYESSPLAPLEERFLQRSGEFVGAFKHVCRDDQDALKIEWISDEALKTSEIEGEILDRDSVQSSLREQFGLATGVEAAPPAERGIAEMLADLYRSFDDLLTHDVMFRWHRMLMSSNRRIQAIGDYRTRGDAMKVVSERLRERTVIFEAPPSSKMSGEMDAFIAWFNETMPGGRCPLSALTRAGIAHLYFVSVHPFEDGNGRIGRALAEKSLAQNMGQPSLIALAYTIERARKAYYAALRRNSREIAITDWLVYFGETVLEAQRNTIRRVDFYIARTKLFEKLRGRLNARQEKVLARMFRDGINAFGDGLSAENYISITGTSRATATRDLQELVAVGALTRTGELRHTRYHLNLA
jgi:Fic family protein